MATRDTATDSPYPRENWWYDHHDEADYPEQVGSDADAGSDATDAARVGGGSSARRTAPEALMVQEVLALTDPLCARSLREDGERIELSEPTLFVPKDHEGSQRTEEYRQHMHRRRYNPETGYISWGESTTVALPELDEDTYMQAVHNVLARLGVLVSHTDAWLTHARRLYHDPQYNSKEALQTFIRHKREYDQGERPSIPS